MANTDSRSAMSPTDAARGASDLQFRVEMFSEEHLPLVAAFSERYWSRPRTEQFYRWRYVESLPFSRLFIARTEEACLGMVCALAKSYRIAGALVPCLEIFDWHSLPGLKGSGVGIRVMRAMMRDGRRLIGIGGTADVMKTLPAMGWETLGTAVYYELPLAGGYLQSAAEERFGVKLPGSRPLFSVISSAWFQPRRRRSRGDVTASATLPPDIDALYAQPTGYDFFQVPDRELTHWATQGYPPAGEFSCLTFRDADGVRGWVLTRVYDTEQGREAAIVDAYAPTADVKTYEWMVREAAVFLVATQPRVIRARSSCPGLQAALTANRFRPGDAVPIFTWPRLAPGASRPHVTLNHGDAWLRPYPKA
jgi:hypothetical protein